MLRRPAIAGVAGAKAEWRKARPTAKRAGTAKGDYYGDNVWARMRKIREEMY